MFASTPTTTEPEPPPIEPPPTSASPPPDAPDEIEGLDAADSWGQYPLDEMLIRNETRSIHEVIRRIRTGRYVMDPDFQRDFLWEEPRQAKLIESVLLRIPLPVFYLAEDSDGRMIVVDGLQRLSTFRRFLDNDLRLHLPDRSELDGRRFDDLPPKLQNRVEDCNLTCYVITSKAPDRARLDIFERVNSGVALTRQQMRNSLYQGAGTQFLRNQAATSEFKEVTGNSLNPKTMRDREFINRFCAFQLLTPAKYPSEMDTFLAKALLEMNDLDPDRLSSLERSFRRALRNNQLLFGRNAFRKHVPDQDWRGIINASLWDVMTTGLADYSEARVRDKEAPLRAAFFSLLQDEGFAHAITYSTNSRKQVLRRFTDAHRTIAAAFDV